MAAEFSISTPSRHPALQNAYDATRHRYRPEYIQPPFWLLTLDAGPLFPRSSTGDAQPPQDLSSLTWAVSELDGPFRKTVTQDRPTRKGLTAEVQVPRTGDYEISLTMSVTGQRSQRVIRRYRLRDFLVVGIGDSFAAGQGNPDVPAIPSWRQRAACEVTTALLALTKIQDEISKFLQALQARGEVITEYLPVLGKVIVAVSSGVDDVVSHVKGAIKDLGNAVLDLVENVGHAIVDGVQELFSLGGSDDTPDPRPARWQEPLAYRSYRSSQSLAAKQIEADHKWGADRITFLSFARTGAEVQDGLLGPRTVDPNLLGTDFSSTSIDGWINNRGQVQEAADTVGRRKVDAMVITISVNDIGFSSLVTNSLLRSKDAKRREIVKGAEAKIADQLPVAFEALKRAIDARLKPQHVFVTEYPTGLLTKFKDNHRVADGGPCGVLSSTDLPNTSTGLDVDVDDGRELRRLGKLLNGVLRAKSAQFGWTFIDGIEHAFDGHGYCAHRSYFVSAEESCRNQGDFEGMLHPNKKGHEIARDYIARTLQRELLEAPEGWLEPVLIVMMQ